MLDFNNMLNIITNEVHAREVSMLSRNDVYHFYKALREFGEEQLHYAVSKTLQERDNISFIQASAMASNRIQYCVELINNVATFKEARDRLKNEKFSKIKVKG